jgi:Protein of unknown function (DUF4038)
LDFVTHPYRALDVSFDSTSTSADPWREIDAVAVVMRNDRVVHRVPMYWAGGKKWVARVSVDVPGEYRLVVDSNDAPLKGKSQTFRVEASPETETNPLFKRGPIVMSKDRTHFVHADGSPFYWLGDTWWMLMSGRVKFPEQFRRLSDNRRERGFNVVQTVVGFPGDSTPFEDDVADNEGGAPWLKDYASINPAYFDRVDEKLAYLISIGISPCILGCWGYHLLYKGDATMRLHWKYVVARYGAWPVTWCLAGEGAMVHYLAQGDKEQISARLKAGWGAIGQYVKSIDTYNRPLTIHPRRSSWDDMDDAAKTLDFFMIQPGHMPNAIDATHQTLDIAKQKFPGHATINAEPPYEGHGGTNLEDVQRYSFWASFTCGAVGYTYGAAGIFQANDKDRPTNKRPDGGVFDRWTWDQAMMFKGAQQIGKAVELVRSWPWQNFEVHPEWVQTPLKWGEGSYHPKLRTYACGIPGEIRVLYLPLRWYHWDGPIVCQLEPGVKYKVTYIDPATFDKYEQGIAMADAEGRWQGTIVKYLHDWVVLMERAK